MRNLAGVDRIDDWRDRKELVPGTRHQHNKFCLTASLLPFMQKQSFPTIAGRQLIGICTAYIILPAFPLSIRSLMHGGECLTTVNHGWLLSLFSATARSEIGRCPVSRTYFGKSLFTLALYKFIAHFFGIWDCKACGLPP